MRPQWKAPGCNSPTATSPRRFPAAWACAWLTRATSFTRATRIPCWSSRSFSRAGESARVQLAYCHIAAPISGRVGLRLVDAGNIVHASDTNPLLVITELQPITVIFNVAEDDLPRIQKQLRLGKQLVVDAFDRDQQNKLATGTLETMDNQIDPTTGMVKFRAVFTNHHGS